MVSGDDHKFGETLGLGAFLAGLAGLVYGWPYAIAAAATWGLIWLYYYVKDESVREQALEASRHVATKLGLEFESDTSDLSLHLEGRVDGWRLDVESRLAKDPGGRSTVVHVDLSDELPDWLEVRRAESASTPTDEDILVGTPDFDRQFVVRGRHEHDVRELFATSGLDRLLGRLGADYEIVWIDDGTLALGSTGVPEDWRNLETLLEDACRAASRIAERNPEIASDFDDDPEDAEKSRRVHVYD